MFGPQDAGIAKLKDIYRKVIYLRDEDYNRLILIKDELEKYLLEENTYRLAHVSFDFDPTNGF